MSLGLLVCLASSAQCARAQEFDLNPTRPTIANSVGIQSKGVLQVEVGQDSYPELIPGDQQTSAISIFYAPLDRLRLDLGWSALASQITPTTSDQGVGTLQLGGKFILRQEAYHKAYLGLAVQYEATLPTASRPNLQDKGQQLILLVSHHYGKDGKLDGIVNGSLVQSGCADPAGCRYTGQQSIALSFHVQKDTRLYAEVFGQNNSASNTPPGTYAFGGFYHKFNDSFGLDGGMRFGLSDHSASFGPTLGIVFGKRLTSSHPSKITAAN